MKLSLALIVAPLFIPQVVCADEKEVKLFVECVQNTTRGLTSTQTVSGVSSDNRGSWEAAGEMQVRLVDAKINAGVDDRAMRDAFTKASATFDSNIAMYCLASVLAHPEIAPTKRKIAAVPAARAAQTKLPGCFPLIEVFDSIDHRPISDASISLGGAVQGTTNEHGFLCVSHENSASTIHLQAIGYRPVTQSGVSVANDGTTLLAVPFIRDEPEARGERADRCYPLIHVSDGANNRSLPYAAISVNGGSIGSTTDDGSLCVSQLAGRTSVTVQVQLTGYREPPPRRVRLEADGTTRVEMQLFRDQVPASVRHEHAKNAQREQPVDHRSSGTTAPAQSGQTPSWWSTRSPWLYLSGVGTAVSLAGTLVAWRLEESAASRWNDDSRCLRSGSTREQNCGDDRRAAMTARAWEAVGGVGTAVLLTTTLLLALPSDSEKPGPAARMRCASFGMAGLSCAAAF